MALTHFSSFFSSFTFNCCPGICQIQGFFILLFLLFTKKQKWWSKWLYCRTVWSWILGYSLVDGKTLADYSETDFFPKMFLIIKINLFVFFAAFSPLAWLSIFVHLYYVEILQLVCLTTFVLGDETFSEIPVPLEDFWVGAFFLSRERQVLV